MQGVDDNQRDNTRLTNVPEIGVERNGFKNNYNWYIMEIERWTYGWKKDDI